MSQPPRGRGGARPGAGRKPDAIKQLFNNAVERLVTQETMDALVRSLVDAALGGNVKATALLLDRLLGKVPQALVAASDSPTTFIIAWEDGEPDWMKGT